MKRSASNFNHLLTPLIVVIAIAVSALALTVMFFMTAPKEKIG